MFDPEASYDPISINQNNGTGNNNYTPRIELADSLNTSTSSSSTSSLAMMSNEYSITQNGKTVKYTKEEFIEKLNSGDYDGKQYKIKASQTIQKFKKQ